ncbi:MAG TPA: sigma-70 family RNA polymerase sigma factor [Candidatus Limnocylindrales bacterium]|nr:sigma-70 family RNA polymerase sigma factor [Candidatus Limnocylindrales bacterium]
METTDEPVITSVVAMGDVRRGAMDVETIVVEAFDAHAGRLKAFAQHAVRDIDAADDLVQESFLRLVAEVRSGTVPDNVGGWLYRVCGNLIVSRGRRRSVADRMKSLLVDRGVAPSPEDRVVRADESARLTGALADLPADARVALLMAAAGYSSAEIGSAIGRTENATLSYVCRSRIRLRELLATAEGPVR